MESNLQRFFERYAELTGLREDPSPPDEIYEPIPRRFSSDDLQDAWVLALEYMQGRGTATPAAASFAELSLHYQRHQGLLTRTMTSARHRRVADLEGQRNCPNKRRVLQSLKWHRGEVRQNALANDELWAEEDREYLRVEAAEDLRLLFESLPEAGQAALSGFVDAWHDYDAGEPVPDATRQRVSRARREPHMRHIGAKLIFRGTR
jgi:hypothetical protein